MSELKLNEKHFNFFLSNFQISHIFVKEFERREIYLLFIFYSYLMMRVLMKESRFFLI